MAVSVSIGKVLEAIKKEREADETNLKEELCSEYCCGQQMRKVGVYRVERLPQGTYQEVQVLFDEAVCLCCGTHHTLTPPQYKY